MSRLHQAGFAPGWSEAALGELMAGAHTLALGAFEDDTDEPRLLGFTLISIVADEAEILTLVVDPGARRRGVARQLLGQVIVSAGASGATTLFLEVSDANTGARALYGDFSFAEVARRHGYYRSEGGADAVVMRLNL